MDFLLGFGGAILLAIVIGGGLLLWWGWHAQNRGG